MTSKLYWAYVGFVETSGGKKRPVLYLRETETDYIVFRLTSKYDQKSKWIKQKYIEVKDWRSAGLPKRSWIDTVKTYSLPKEMTELTYIGQLSTSDQVRLGNAISDETDS